MRLVQTQDIIMIMYPTDKIGTVLESWGEWQRDSNLSNRTITERADTIRRFLLWSHADPLLITAQDILRYLDRPGLANSSRATYHGHIKAYCLWLVKTHQVETNPVDDTPSPRRNKGVPRPITGVQLRHVLLVVNRRRTRMMLLLAAFQGLRVHEIAKIAGQDFDRGAGVLYVTGKGGKTAVLPIHPLVEEAMALFPELDYWFPSYTNAGPVAPAAVSKAIHGALVRAGVKATPHQLRHFYGTSLARNGVNLRVVQELMRHSSLATTQIYVMVDERQMRDGLATLQLPAA
jgi:integrase/recombinase XerD